MKTMAAGQLNHDHDHGLAPTIDAAAPSIAELLDAGQIVIAHQTTSKKRLLEDIADRFAACEAGIDAQQVFATLIGRENLGSTGIGAGVALPHGRIAGLEHTIGIFMTLAQPLDFDSIDHERVSLVFAILVPEQATEEHLKLLASLAALFSRSELRERLRESRSPDEVRALLTGGLA